VCVDCDGGATVSAVSSVSSADRDLRHDMSRLSTKLRERIRDYLRFTDESIRPAIEEYLDDRKTSERRHGEIGSWDARRSV